MFFGEIPLPAAEGAILAHSLRHGGLTYKKGRRLSTQDITALAAAGVKSIVGARLAEDDRHEDEAAAALGGKLAGPGLIASAAHTGRVNLIAEGRGLFTLERAAVDALNGVNEAVTLATLPPFAAVEPRQIVATVKIIPFAVPDAVLTRCLAIAGASGHLMTLAPFRARRVGLLQSHLPSMKRSLLDKTKAAVDARLAVLDCPPAEERRAAHAVEPVAAALAELLDSGCEMVLLAGASAIVDRGDVLPAAMVRCGGQIVHFGLPVDPGNLLLLAYRGSVPLLGLPGCARSPKLNGFDWVLERLMADLAVKPADMTAMGVGGLLKEIPARPLPRTAAVDGRGSDKGRAPKVAGLLLAAGQSRRMGGANKLLADIGGAPMLARAAAGLKASRAAPLLAVSGHDYEAVEALLSEAGIAYIHNPAYAEGVSASLKRGLGALPGDIDGVVVCLGDMPLVSAAVIDRLIAAFDPAEGRAICVPSYRGKRGNPMLFASRFIPELQTLTGDVGARGLLSDYAALVCEVPVEVSGVLLDADTPQSLAALRHS